MGGGTTPPEENTDLLKFYPERAHLLLQGVYGDFPHHNNGLHLEGGSRTTLYVSVFGTGLLLNKQAGTTCPLER